MGPCMPSPNLPRHATRRACRWARDWVAQRVEKGLAVAA